MQKVQAAVILSAGLGSRMLPITKAISKSLLPIANKPSILLQVEECLSVGIMEIVIVQNQKNSQVEKFFKYDRQLAKLLLSHGKPKEAKMLSKISKSAKFIFVTQKNLLGEANALLSAKKFLKKPFAVFFNDNLYPKKACAIRQLLKRFRKTGKHIKADGRFIFLPSIFQYIKKFNYRKQNMKMAKGPTFEEVFAMLPNEIYETVKIRGKKYDIGNPKRYIEAFNELSREVITNA